VLRGRSLHHCQVKLDGKHGIRRRALLRQRRRRCGCHVVRRLAHGAAAAAVPAWLHPELVREQHVGPTAFSPQQKCDTCACTPSSSYGPPLSRHAPHPHLPSPPTASNNSSSPLLQPLWGSFPELPHGQVSRPQKLQHTTPSPHCNTTQVFACFMTACLIGGTLVSPILARTRVTTALRNMFAVAAASLLLPAGVHPSLPHLLQSLHPLSSYSLLLRTCSRR
jgi:hypothetical protein